MTPKRRHLGSPSTSLIPRLPQLTTPQNLAPPFPFTRRTSRTPSKHSVHPCHPRFFHHLIRHRSAPVRTPTPPLIQLHPILRQFVPETSPLPLASFAIVARETHQQVHPPLLCHLMIHRHISHKWKTEQCNLSNGSKPVPMYQRHYALHLADRKPGTPSLQTAWSYGLGLCNISPGHDTQRQTYKDRLRRSSYLVYLFIIYHRQTSRQGIEEEILSLILIIWMESGALGQIKFM
jgi:hypothetical protein